MYTPVIKGIPVLLHVKTQSGVDDFNTPIFSDSTEQIENVVVAPVTAEDYTEVINLTGKHAVYKLCIPKFDMHTWENTIVEFFGKKWRTIGSPKIYMDHLVPLNWNKQIMVERYE